MSTYLALNACPLQAFQSSQKVGSIFTLSLPLSEIGLHSATAETLRTICSHFIQSTLLFATASTTKLYKAKRGEERPLFLWLHQGMYKSSMADWRRPSTFVVPSLLPYQ